MRRKWRIKKVPGPEITPSDRRDLWELTPPYYEKVMTSYHNTHQQAMAYMLSLNAYMAYMANNTPDDVFVEEAVRDVDRDDLVSFFLYAASVSGKTRFDTAIYGTIVVDLDTHSVTRTPHI